MKNSIEDKIAQFSIPFYAKASIIIIGLYVLLYMLYIGQEIIIPLIFSAMIAIILHPLVEFLNNKGINRIISIVISITLAISIITGLILIILSQASNFFESWPIIIEKFSVMLNETVVWLSNKLHTSPKAITNWVDKSTNEFLSLSSPAIGNTLSSIGNALVVLFLIPVYVFLFLYYQPLLMEFLRKIVGTKNREKVSIIAFETKVVIHQYLFGLVIEFIIVAILNTAGLWILGIEYSLLLGILGALLNIIPYLGGILAVAIYMMVSLVTIWPPSYSLLVFALYAIIQFIDNNIIVPKIVASKVQINALITIIAVISGGLFWGLSGMFLSIPIIAIVKLIFDHIEQLKPWGFLLGDAMEYNEEMPRKYKRSLKNKKLMEKKLPQ